MKYNRFLTTGTAVAVILWTGVAFAHEADTTILAINGNAVIPGQPLPLVLPYIPYTVMIEGIVSHAGDNLNRLMLWGTDNGVYFYEPTRYFQGSGSAASASFAIPWTIASEGIHRLRVEATHDSQSRLAAQCKAAPALAIEHLKGGNQATQSVGGIISSVAQETGSKGELSAQRKCEPGYRDEVIFYITAQ